MIYGHFLIFKLVIFKNFELWQISKCAQNLVLYCSGGVPTILLNATPLMAPIRKVTNVCGSALTIMTGFIVMLMMIRSDALTVPTHLDMVHTALSTER